MEDKKGELIFVSRHEPTAGQVVIAVREGFTGMKRVEVKFSTGDKFDPVKDLEDAGVTRRFIALVAPIAVVLTLLRERYLIIEFINVPSSKEKGEFDCAGAWFHLLGRSRFVSCPEGGCINGG